MNKDDTRRTPQSRPDVQPAASGIDKTPVQTPLQPPEPPDESVLQSIGNAISAPVRDAAEDDERKQTGQPRKG